ncbi:BlaR1 peptidase M56 [Cyclobacterium lianum]|uniref:BlaR1 peptidase M56 n=1 Tax=Cyclobacterium lianum TaxID=388280 RepID=A0A1M7QU29_9BACT|nr:M56 family metallopeptidase [Cyclobacterium lianum]SHN35358.1 BlaR1 peptidase M56 [Cyclobacterium lianum]
MEQLLYYLLKVAIATAVFYLSYLLLLRKSKQFVFNRVYLAGSFLAAFVIPLISFTKSSYVSPAVIYFSGAATKGPLPEEATAIGTQFLPNMAAILAGLYLCGVLWCLLRLVIGYLAAARIGCKAEDIAGQKVWIAEKNNLAFTFIDRIIIGRNLLDHPALEMVLKHEAVHRREQHFVDIILSELLSALQWFNPFAKLQARAIRNNLEFRADDLVIRASDKKEYQYTMLSMALNRIKSPLFTGINSSSLKKRIVMMNAKENKRFAGLYRLAVLPVFVLLLLSLSGKKTVVISDPEPEVAPLAVAAELQDRAGDPIDAISEVNRFFSRNLKYPKEARAAGHVGIARIYARVSPDGRVSEVSDIKPAEEYVEFDEVVIIGYSNGTSEELKRTRFNRHPGLLAEGKRVVASLPRLEIAELQGKLVQFYFKFDLRSAPEKSKIWTPAIDRRTIDAISG